MLKIVHPEMEGYLNAIRAPRDGILAEMEAVAKEKSFPIVGPDVGRLFFAFARFAGAKRVLELGSGYGYSAYWFATAMPADGIVHCIDLEPENKETALAYFARGGMSEKIEFHLGDALEVARGLTGSFDIIFNDIQKEGYPDSIEVALPLLRSGGLFITDNTLWRGRVVDENPDSKTRGVVEFNRRLAERDDVEVVIVPIRDGLSVVVKL